MGEGVSPPVLDVTPFPVGNNSMPPVAFPRLGTSGCDYTGRIEFDKKPALRNVLGVARSIYAMTGSSRPYAASNATCLRSFTRQLCSSSSRPDL